LNNIFNLSSNFIKTKNNPSKVIINQVDTARVRQVMENQMNIKPIIEAIALWERQDLALRGHKDYSQHIIELSENDNEGNF